MSNSGLRIDFDGLVSLVPLKKVEDKNEAKKWLVALPDLRSTLVSTRPVNLPAKAAWIPATIPPHVACLIVPDDAVVDTWSTKAPSLIFESRQSFGRLMRLYELQDQGLRLEYAGKSRLKATYTPQHGPEPSKPEETHDLFWVAQLGRVGLPGAEIFDSSLIDKDWLPADATERKGGARGLTSLVEIDGGTLKVDDVSRWSNGDPVVFDFKPLESDKVAHAQAQGAHIMMEDRLEGDGLRIRFGRRSASGGRPQWQDVLLRPAAQDLHLSVANLELEVLLGIGNPLDAGRGAGAFADLDFAVHYMLSKAWPFEQALPVPHPRGNEEPESGGRPKTCKGGAWAGVG
jgi:hypothetical protein